MRFFGLAVLVFVSIAAWRIAGQLSADAIGMAVGVLFGVLAGLPTALLVMASSRRREQEREAREEAAARRRQNQQHAPQGYYGGYGPGYAQPPVIVLAAPGQQMPQGYGQPGYGQQGFGYPHQGGGMRPALPGADTVDVRQFKVVGEKEEWVDEW